MTFSVGIPQFLGDFGEYHDPLVAITLLVGSSLAASPVADMRSPDRSFLVIFLRAYQST